jgi:hypothetical protein
MQHKSKEKVVNRNIHVNDAHCSLKYASVAFNGAFARAVQEAVKSHGFDPQGATKVDLDPMTHEVVYNVTLAQEHADTLVSIAREMSGNGYRGVALVPACNVG